MAESESAGVTVKSRAHRTLRHLQSYEMAPSLDLTRLRTPPLREGECWLGVYWNNPQQIDDSILFSDQRLCVHRSESWTCIDYASISDVTVPHQKHTANGLTIHHGTEETYVPIRGGESKLRDAWEVLRFLDRVREDLGKMILR
jgi:hypothetical protein